jgi:L-ectoine synthase
LIVRNLNRIINTDKDVRDPNGNWISRRLITKKDGMGFSVNDTIIKAGTETKIWYKNHLEAVYCVSGNGSIEDMDTGIIHDIEPGALYALNDHDRHVLRSGTEDMHMVCIFYPALKGDEVHDEDGSYPASE